MDYPVTRTPEEGHSRKCLAKAMIAAIENLRDSSTSDIEFRIDSQNNTALIWADSYLANGDTECICPPNHATN